MTGRKMRLTPPYPRPHMMVAESFRELLRENRQRAIASRRNHLCCECCVSGKMKRLPPPRENKNQHGALDFWRLKRDAAAIWIESMIVWALRHVLSGKFSTTGHCLVPTVLIARCPERR